MNIMSSEDPGYIADFIAHNVSMRVLDKQSILDELRPVQRLNKINRLLHREVEILEMEQNIQRRVQENMTQNQKDAFLREQVRVIQEELGEDGDNEITAYRRQIMEAKLPEEVTNKLLKEVTHLEKQPFGSAESSVLRNYLDVCLELPWTKTSKERVSVSAARKILDADHYGLEKVKERVLEFLAVKQLAPDLKGQILCLVGPPGVGKTSIAMSVARALNRKLARISWAASTMRRTSGATGRLTWGPCPGGSSMPSARPAPRTPSSCWTRSTNWAATSGEIPPPPCWRCWTASRTAPSGTISWSSPSTCPMCSS